VLEQFDRLHRRVDRKQVRGGSETAGDPAGPEAVGIGLDDRAEAAGRSHEASNLADVGVDRGEIDSNDACGPHALKIDRPRWTSAGVRPTIADGGGPTARPRHGIELYRRVGTPTIIASTPVADA